MYEWAIIDGDDVCYNNAKKIRANHPTPIPPVQITRVTAIDFEGKLRLIIHTNMPISIEKCADRGCIHLTKREVFGEEK